MDSAQEVGVQCSEQGPKAKKHLGKWAPPSPLPHLEPPQGWAGAFLQGELAQGGSWR